MTDLLIRDVPEDVVAPMDTKARRLGISRTEYVRRVLTRESATSSEIVEVQDLSRVAETCADIADDNIMRQAWQ